MDDPADAPVEFGERRTSPVELLWDLVFVFAVTQVTTLLSSHLTWTGLGQAMLVLALVWWSWSAFVWAANAQAAGSQLLRIVLLVATAFIFVAGQAVPHAWGSEAVLFAATYSVVRFLHLATYVDASRQGNAAWSAIAGFALTVAIGMALLLAGSFAHGAPRAVLWTIAVAIDYAGPAWLTRERLRGLQRVAVAHFAERYSLFVIICLGESIITIGAGASREHLDLAVVAAVTLGLLVAIGLWWTYFDNAAALAEERLRGHEDPVLAAADSYSYVHLVLVAGIIIFAAGVRFVVRAPAETLEEPARLALCGGVALYLAGHAAFLVRMLGTISFARLLVAILLLLVFAFGGGLVAWLLTGVVAVLLALLSIAEAPMGPAGISPAKRRVAAG